MPTKFSRLTSSLLSGLYCGAICFGSMAMQTPFSSPAFAQDALEALSEGGQAVAANAQAEQQAELKKQLSEALYQELDKLVPGEQAAGSPAAEALHSAADAYVERKGDMAMSILEQSAASNKEFPPAELMMAGLHFSAKNQNGGILALQAAAIKNPNHPAVYAAYGRLASGTNRNVDAKVHFEKLLALLDQVKLDEASVAHYENVYLGGMSQVSLRLKDFEQARNLSGQLLKRNPENGNALQLLARVDFEEGKFNDAVANLTKFRAANPKARVPEAVVGTWFARKGEKGKANNWFSKLPAKYPNDGAAQLDYASWALGQEDVEGAAAAITKAEATGGVNASSNTLKGKIAFYQRKYDDAVAIFKALYESSPQNAELANLYVLSMIESSDAENRVLANKVANLNLKANQNNRVALAVLGYVRLRTAGVNNQIKAIFGKVAQTRDGRSPEVDYFLASFLKEAGNAKSALAVIQQTSKYEGLFLYRRQAEQMKQGLAAGVLPTP